jgi:hypothetical protein
MINYIYIHIYKYFYNNFIRVHLAPIFFGFRVAGAALRMPWSHFSWQAQYFADLD